MKLLKEIQLFKERLQKMNYMVDWEKTFENINFLMSGRTYKKNFAELFGIVERAAQRKLSTCGKKRLSITELMMLADYFECDVSDLIILDGERYVAPEIDWQADWRKSKVDDKSPEDVSNTLEMLSSIKEDYEIRNLSEFLLYLPLIEEEILRDTVYRCFGNLTYNNRHYVMEQLSGLYHSIPDCEAKRDADKYRDNVLRVKGVPGNNLFGLMDENYNKYYFRNLQRYVEDGNSELWSYEYKRDFIEQKRKGCLGCYSNSERHDELD